jgi:phosphatidylinositol-3-phosphatase
VISIEAAALSIGSRYVLKSLLIAMLAMQWLLVGPGIAGEIRHVIVIAMENVDARDIYGNVKQAPYINTALMPAAARATAFMDMLSLSVPSGPHYILMQAAAREFPDHTFTTNADPSARNSTASNDHLIALLGRSSWAIKPSWMSYQQGMGPKTGACPIASDYPYAARHNPFVYFRSISGNPPAKNTAYCAAHHKPLKSFAADMTANRLANYVFITPDMCHNMHDRCGQSSRIRAGDKWLEDNLPAMIAWSATNRAVIFIMWDEAHATPRLPFFAIGPGVKKGFASGVKLDHRSFVKSLSQIFGLPVLETAKSADNFSSLFKPGAFP